MLKFKSKVGKGSTDTIRTTIPKGLRQLLEINPGDKVEWIVNITENKNIEVTFKKIK